MSEEVNPFESPEASGEPVEGSVESASGGRPVIPFESGHPRAMWTVVFLALCFATDLVGAGFTGRIGICRHLGHEI